jgi:hypothetical protein
VRGGDVRLVIRVGQFHPRYTMAKGYRIERTADDAGNVTMTMTGTPTHIDWVFGDLTGLPVTGYTVRAYRTASGGSAVRTCGSSAAARGCTLTGLARRTRYYVTVSAGTAAGTGAWTARVAVTTK